jgi:hypothetical protein
MQRIILDPLKTERHLIGCDYFSLLVGSVLQKASGAVGGHKEQYKVTQMLDSPGK